MATILLVMSVAAFGLALGSLWGLTAKEQRRRCILERLQEGIDADRQLAKEEEQS